MPTPPPRKRFQIHLSTAIVMMFVAGLLIWMNVALCFVDEDMSTFADRYEWGETFDANELKVFLRRNVDEVSPKTRIVYYGPPYFSNMFTTAVAITDEKGNVTYRELAKHWYIVTIIFNVIFALSIVLGVAAGCEWLIRRRAARKGA